MITNFMIFFGSQGQDPAARSPWNHRGSKGRKGSWSTGDRGGSHLQLDLHGAGRTEAAAAQKAARARVGGLRHPTEQAAA